MFCKKVLLKLQRLPRPSGVGKTSYLTAYTARALLLAAMHREGVEKLGGLDKITVREFQVAFPDQRQWFTELATRPIVSVKEFLGDVGYTGRPEMWSMYSCLLLTRSMWINPDWYTFHAASLKQAMDSQRKHDIMRVPALCVRDVRAKKH